MSIKNCGAKSQFEDFSNMRRCWKLIFGQVVVLMGTIEPPNMNTKVFLSSEIEWFEIWKVPTFLRFFDFWIWISPLWFLSRFGKISNGPISRNTGPIPIIFGALKSYDFSLSDRLGPGSIQQKPILAWLCLLNVKKLEVDIENPDRGGMYGRFLMR